MALPVIVLSANRSISTRAAARPAVTRLHEETIKALKNPTVIARLGKAGAEPMPMSSKEFDAFVRKELDRWGQVFKDSAIQLN